MSCIIIIIIFHISSLLYPLNPWMFLHMQICQWSTGSEDQIQLLFTQLQPDRLLGIWFALVFSDHKCDCHHILKKEIKTLTVWVQYEFWALIFVLPCFVLLVADCLWDVLPWRFFGLLSKDPSGLCGGLLELAPEPILQQLSEQRTCTEQMNTFSPIYNYSWQLNKHDLSNIQWFSS